MNADAAHRNILGDPHAPITLVEFAEFECPHCGRAHFQLKALRERLEDLGVRFVFRHFARDEVHPFSVRAAVAAEAAGAQGKFWQMHDHLFEHQHQLEYADLRRHADEVGLDVERFVSDIRDPRHLAAVHSDGDMARSLGVDGTPTFFLNGDPYEGPYDLGSLVSAIERLRHGHDDRAVDEASMESFPASDPPAYLVRDVSAPRSALA